jgi:protoporphyrinogen oxidase
VPRTLVSKFIYPKHGGVGQIAERLGEEIRKQPGNSIQTGVRIKRIRWSGDKVTSVEYEKDGVTRDEPVELLVSTIPLTVALELFDPAPPPEVMTSKDTLRYKAIVFVFLIVDRPKVTDDHWVYLPEKHLRVHRISEFKNFSEFSAPEGKTLVAAEITCNYEDETWNMDTPALVELAKKDLATAGLIQPHEVHEGFVRRERYSYPLYDLVYREHVKRCLDFMKGFTNFHSSGRQGLFQYGNMDHSLAMGLVLGEKLLRGEGVDHDKLLEEEESVDG